MPIAVTHAFVSAIPDGADTTVVRPSNWNAAHSVDLSGLVVGDVAGAAPLASPTFTGDPRAPTPTAGDNDTSIATTAFVTAAVRERLLASRTYFVATTGNNSNNGLTVGSPFLTLQKAFDVIATIDFSGFTVTIQLANGTYTMANAAVPVTVGQPQPGNLIVLGDTTTPANVIVQGLTGFTPSITATGGAICRLSGIRFQGSVANTYGPTANKGGIIEIDRCDFAGNFWIQLYANGGWILTAGNNTYTISAGPSWAHIQSENAGLFTYTFGSTVTISGTPAWGISGFATATAGVIYAGGSNTFSGASTGTRYNANLNGVINTNGGGASYFPGNSVGGTTATGGQYA